MEISDVRRRVAATIESARRGSVARRARIDEASREFAPFLDQVAVPLFRQVAQVLRAEGYLFTVFTPAGSVRLMSDTSAQDYVELQLDTSGDEPRVMGRSSRSRGRHVIELEETVGRPGPIRDVGEEDVLTFVQKATEPLVAR